MGLAKQWQQSQGDNVPLQFCRTLLVQARAFGKDVDAIIAGAAIV